MAYRFFGNINFGANFNAVSNFIGLPWRRWRKTPYGLILAASAAYLIVGLLGAVPIYGFRLDNGLTRLMEAVFPYPAAVVDGGAVTLRSMHRQENFVDQYIVRTGQAAGGETPREKVLNQLIENKLIGKAAAKQGFRLPLEEVDRAYNKVLQENGGKDQIEKVLKNLYNMSLADFKALVRAQLLKDKVRDELLVRTKARHILLKDEKRAEEVLEKVKKGENWDELAKQYSEDTASRDKGGDLGFNGRGALVKGFEDAAFGLKPGETSQVLIKTEFGFHIIRVDERNQGKIDKSYDDYLKELKEITRIIKLVQ